MKYYLDGKEVTLEELNYAFNRFLDGDYRKQIMEVEKIENGNIYFTIVYRVVYY